MSVERTVLLVDDNEEFLDVLRAMIPDGFRTLCARTGAQACEIAESQAVDIVLLDIFLTDGDGYDVCRRIKKLYALRPLQIVLVSGMMEPEMLGKVLAAGADDFIRKPFDDLELQLRLKAAMIRLLAQEQLYGEREYFRQAVIQEERISSRLLDEHDHLKRALGRITEIRSALIESNKRLESMAQHDALTGLLNRESLLDRLVLEAERPTDADTLCGIMLDIDRFSAIRDSYGSDAADAVVRETGWRLKRHLRREDGAGRVGGDRFFIVVFGIDIDRTQDIAERVLESLRSSPVIALDAEIYFTASAGVVARASGEPGEAWMMRAERALLRAKNAGRDRVIVSSD